MLKKIFICANDSYCINNLNNCFLNQELIQILKINTKDFMHYNEFDIINLPTSFMEEFGSKPMKFECQIIKTENKYNLPDYVVTSPNFVNETELSTKIMSQYQIESPLLKVIEFSKTLNKNIYYAIHAEYAFSYTDCEFKSIENIKSSFERILNQFNK